MKQIKLINMILLGGLLTNTTPREKMRIIESLQHLDAEGLSQAIFGALTYAMQKDGSYVACQNVKRALTIPSILLINNE